MEKKNKLVYCVGLPASGKTTWTKQQVKASEGRIKRVNKDDLRELIDAGTWSREKEEVILVARDMLIELFLSEGYTVIVDDTNFAETHAKKFKELATAAGVPLENKKFNVPLEKCLGRNAKRAKPVPEGVIRDMHRRYAIHMFAGMPITEDSVDRVVVLPIVQNKDNCKAIVVDLDGTLAHHVDRGPFEFMKCGSDTVDAAVLHCSRAMLNEGYRLIFVSGREDICRQETLDWLESKCGLQLGVDFELYMRKAKDNRKDAIVKEEIYRELVKSYYIEVVLDDRQQVVDHLRDLGFKVFQAQPGNF